MVPQKARVHYVHTRRVQENGCGRDSSHAKLTQKP
jgi:hypothetical protein